MKSSEAVPAVAAFVLTLAGSVFAAGKAGPSDVSGRYYDWTLTRRPERPYRHSYHQTLTMKMFLAGKKQGGTDVHLTFEQALEVIRKVDHVTRGIPKIFYLVGWQYDGHDSKYPAWFEVNPALKRKQDETALASLRWLMDASFRHHTTVSLHINMLDAAPDSPLWDTYVKNDILAKEKNGRLRRYRWGYPISYAREWQTGHAQKRIDRLCERIPLERAGTVHIDAFHSLVPGKGAGPISPGHGIPLEQEIETQRKIFRYWRNKGVDVTSEFVGNFRKDPFVGLQPMAWHFRQSEDDYLKRPASLCCGGVDPGPLGKLFGTSMHGEDLIGRAPKTLKGFLRQFCLQTLPWYYLNGYERLRVEGGEAYFSDGLVSGPESIRHRGRLLRDGGDVCIPAPWRPNKELIAYSATGYSERKWQLPRDWRDVSRVVISEITLKGLRKLAESAVIDGQLTLSLKEDQGVTIVPRNAGKGGRNGR